MTPEQEWLDKVFDSIWEKANWLEPDETEKQLSYLPVEHLLRPFTI